jgi:hypothetical protein
MSSRRELLFGLGAGALGILTAQMERRIFSPSSVLALPPSPTIITLDEVGGAFDLHYGDPYDLPEVTWGEYLLRTTGATNIDEACAICLEEDDHIPEDLDELVDDEELVLSVVGRMETSTGGAYEMLHHLDLGPRLDEGGEVRHFVEFIDGGCPGNDSLGVRVPDVESLALLQNRLDELESGIQLARGES